MSDICPICLEKYDKCPHTLSEVEKKIKEKALNSPSDPEFGQFCENCNEDADKCKHNNPSEISELNGYEHSRIDCPYWIPMEVIYENECDSCGKTKPCKYLPEGVTKVLACIWKNKEID